MEWLKQYCESLSQQVEELGEENARLKSMLKIYPDLIHFEKLWDQVTAQDEQSQELIKRIAALEEVQAKGPSPSTGGRKSKATPALAAKAATLREDGCSFQAIADALSLETGTAWNKGSVAYMLKQRDEDR